MFTPVSSDYFAMFKGPQRDVILPIKSRASKIKYFVQGHTQENGEVIFQTKVQKSL